MRLLRCLLTSIALAAPLLAAAADRPGCGRPLSLALHEHGLLYSNQTGEGIDKDIAHELIRRSGCKVSVSLMPRARIWQLIESGALDFSLSGITNDARDQFAAFAWYFSNKYYLLVRKDASVQKLAEFQRNPALKLGVIRGFRYSATANKFVDQLDDRHRVTYATSLEPLYQVLIDGRIQAMV